MSRLNRFLHLERQRAPDDRAPGRDEGREGRFAGLDTTEGTSSSQRTGFDGDRFGSSAPPERPLVAREDDGRGLAFIRCRECHHDNFLTATACAACDASLCTPAQRAFNEALEREDQEMEHANRQEQERFRVQRALQKAASEAERLRAEWAEAPLGNRLLTQVPRGPWRSFAVVGSLGAGAALLLWGSGWATALVLAATFVLFGVSSGRK